MWTFERLRPRRAARARRATALLLVGLAPGCAGLFHKPIPDADRPMDERPWRVQCHWVLPPSAEPGAPPGPADSGWVWAADAAGRRLVVEGDLEDGFLAATSAQAASDEDDRDVAPFPTTSAAVAQACTETLARGEETAAARLVAARGAREGEKVAVPLVFPGDPAHPRPVSRIVVFGDSLSDDGNLKRRLRVFPASPYWLGRFSNGPNWADHLAHAGLAVRNDAYGGALATAHADLPAADLISAVEQGGQFFVSGSLDRQVRDYLERDLAGGVLARPDQTAFVLWGGANDYISKEPFSGEISTLLDRPEAEAGYRRVVNETVSALVDQVRRLHAARARRIAVMNLPNLGLTPIALHNESYRPRGAGEVSEGARRIELATKLAELTLYHNRELNRALSELARELPDAQIIPLNAALAFYWMLEGRSPADGHARFDYGFDLKAHGQLLRDKRRGLHLEIQDRCYSGGYLGSHDPAKVCPDPDDALFWDTVHPSSQMHCWIAWFVAQEFVAAGWLRKAPSQDTHHGYCEALHRWERGASAPSPTDGEATER